VCINLQMVSFNCTLNVETQQNLQVLTPHSLEPKHSTSKFLLLVVILMSIHLPDLQKLKFHGYFNAELLQQ